MDKDRIVVYADSELKDLIPGFLVNRGRDVERLNTALQAGDCSILSAIAHDLKGLGSAYGFPEISGLGSALEAVAKAGDLEQAGQYVGRLAHYLSRLEIIYDA